jgi:TRAP-type C4-dicarboxylate transport system substrate-binding protein
MKKTLSLLLAVVFVLGLCLGISACGGKTDSNTTPDTNTETNTGTDANTNNDAQPVDDGKVYEFTLSMHDPKTTANAIYIQSWIDKVAEATDGHVKITLYDNATLSAATDIGDNVKSGAVDIGWLYTSYYAGQFPLSDVINLPMQGFGDPVVSTNVLWDLAEKYEDVEKEWGDFKLLMLYGNPGMIFACPDKPITSLADLKGMTIRCPSGAITDVLGAWGASPISMPPPDLYEAIEKKNIDGYIFEPAGICNFSLEEITHYYTDYPMYDGPFSLIMNKDQWNSLPAEYQAAIDAVSGKEASLGAAQAFADDVEVKRDQITAAGGEFVTLTDEAIAEFAVEADKYAETWVSNMSKDGFDAAAYLADAKALAEQYK